MFKVTGSIYEPGGLGADASGYVSFWDVVEAADEAEAVALTEEDYGEYMNVACAGAAKSKSDEEAWLAKNKS